MTAATIYALADSRSPECLRYIGQTRIDLSQRLRRHWITALAGAREHRAVWMRSVKTAGGDVLITSVDRVSSSDADAAEIAHVARVRALGCDLTNKTAGGRGKRGWEVSAETRIKMSESAARRKASLKTRQKMSQSIRSSASHRAHLVRLHQLNRRPCSMETRKRISAALQGEGNRQNVLTWESVATIRKRYAEGVRQAQLGREFHVSPGTIHRVVHGRGWVRS